MTPEIRKILYVTDLSRNAAYAFRYAVRFMRSFDAELVILTVLKSFNPVDQVPVVVQMGEDRFKKAREEALKTVLDRLKKRIDNYAQKELKEDERNHLIDRITIEVKEGDPSVRILETAEEENADMVIMGAHSKEVLKYTFLGGVTQRVLRHIRKPVLVVPIPKGSFELSFKEDDTL